MRILYVPLLAWFLATGMVCAQTDMPVTLKPLVGIGVVVVAHNDQAVIHEILPDGPALKAGLKVDDTIVQVDDQRVEDLKDNGRLNLPDVTKLIRGEAGTVVKITVQRSGVADLITIPVARAFIHLPKPQQGSKSDTKPTP